MTKKIKIILASMLVPLGACGAGLALAKKPAARAPFGQPACGTDEFGIAVIVLGSDVNPFKQHDLLLLCGKGSEVGKLELRVQAWKSYQPEATPTPKSDWPGNDGQAHQEDL